MMVKSQNDGQIWFCVCIFIKNLKLGFVSTRNVSSHCLYTHARTHAQPFWFNHFLLTALRSWPSWHTSQSDCIKLKIGPGSSGTRVLEIPNPLYCSLFLTCSTTHISWQINFGPTQKIIQVISNCCSISNCCYKYDIKRVGCVHRDWLSLFRSINYSYL